MTASSWRIKNTADSVRSGEVVACPAEAVWGLSCVIVASSDAAHFAPLLDALDEEQRSRVLSSWPGPVTWLVPNRGYFPSWVTGESNEVAIRVTSAPALSSLCRELGGPVVTTSANWAGAQPAKHLFQVRRYFGARMTVVPGEVNLAGKPSTIKRIKTGEVLR